MRMAKGGQLRGRVTEDQLIGVLDQVEAAEKGRAGGAASGGGGGGKIVVRLAGRGLEWGFDQVSACRAKGDGSLTVPLPFLL